MFDTSQNSIDDPLGPLSSYRCFEFGVTCAEDRAEDGDPRATGPRSSCGPREDSEYMYSVGEYADFLRGLKSDPSQVFVAGIIGNTTPVEVGADMNGSPKLESSCQSSAGTADPGVRLQALLDAFPSRSRTETICNQELISALAGIGRRLRDVVGGSPCLDGAIETPLRCTVEDARGLGTQFEERVEIPECDTPANPEGSANLPCYAIAVDTARCPETNTALAVTVYPLNRTVPTGTQTIVTCAIAE
jgi:hypothetical protein